MSDENEGILPQSHRTDPEVAHVLLYGQAPGPCTDSHCSHGPGTPFPGRPGYVTGTCGHAVALSEWRAGFRECERCPADDEDYDDYDEWKSDLAWQVEDAEMARVESRCYPLDR